jgi:hypothetical protein
LQQSGRPQDRKLLKKYLELLDHLSRHTAFYRLRCNMEQDAARISYQVMSESGVDT